MKVSPHRLLVVRLGIVSLAALIAACAHDTTTQASSSTIRQFSASNLRANADFVPGCSDCDPWIPIAPPQAPAQTIGVAMSGATSQRPRLTCTFGAVVNPTGATPPYTYEWTDGSQDGWQQSYTHLGFGAGATYTVTLTVTDSQGRQGTVSRTVLVGSQYAAAC